MYTVTIAEPVGGSATGGGGYKKGSTATISAIPDEGYVFAGWSGDYSGLDNPASFTYMPNSMKKVPSVENW